MLQLAVGLLGASSVLTEIIVLIDRDIFNATNFFSYFTIQSNVLISAALIGAAMGVTSKLFDYFRLVATVNIVIVGVGFAVLLSGLENTVFTVVAWDNIVLHYVVPFFAAMDILIYKPTHFPKFPYISLLAYPLLYLAYTFVRGSITNWYPYPFLDPNKSTLPERAISVVGLLLLGVLITRLLHKLHKKP